LWRQVDPTDGEGQCVDRGRQYHPAVYCHDEAQKRAAEQSLAKLDQSGRYSQPVALEMVPSVLCGWDSTLWNSIVPMAIYCISFCHLSRIRGKINLGDHSKIVCVFRYTFLTPFERPGRTENL
jgi:hypothetical protein